MRRRRSSRARDGPAIWATAPPVIRTPARPPPTTSSRPPPRHWRTERIDMPKYSAALDQGTTSSRAMIFDHGGQVVAVSQKEHDQIYPKPGWVEHDPKEVWAR